MIREWTRNTNGSQKKHKSHNDLEVVQPACNSNIVQEMASPHEITGDRYQWLESDALDCLQSEIKKQKTHYISLRLIKE